MSALSELVVVDGCSDFGFLFGVFLALCRR